MSIHHCQSNILAQTPHSISHYLLHSDFITTPSYANWLINIFFCFLIPLLRRIKRTEGSQARETAENLDNKRVYMNAKLRSRKDTKKARIAKIYKRTRPAWKCYSTKSTSNIQTSVMCGTNCYILLLIIILLKMYSNFQYKHIKIHIHEYNFHSFIQRILRRCAQHSHYFFCNCGSW